MAGSGKVNLAPDITAVSRYEALQQDRNQFLVRGRQCAALTVPALLPEQGFSASSSLPTPYQSLGARGVRMLASKLLLSLFPGVPFFQYKVDDQVLEEMGTKRGDFELALAGRERATVTELDTSIFRPACFTLLQHLLVTGNAVLYTPPEPNGRCRVYRLDQYVVRRDPSGNVLEMVIREPIGLAALEPEVRQHVSKADRFKDADPLTMANIDVDLYTHLYWDPESDRWVVYQEAEGIRLPGTEGTYLKHESPFTIPRLVVQPGEHYGRSYVEEYLGDLDSLEALSETLVEGSAASARVVFLVNPSGVTQLKVVANARNGDVVSGDAQDVQAMQVNKAADLSVAKDQAQEIGQRLAYAFLLHSSIQRNGERVTAEEIRYMASELDDALGGVYTLLAAELQLPIVRLFEKRMEKRLGVPKLDTKMAKPVIVAGLEAIGRGHDLQNLRAFAKEIIGVLGPELAMKYLNPSEFISRAAAAYAIDTTNLLATEEQIQQQEQQAMLLQMAGSLGPEGIKQMGGMGNTMLKAQLEGGGQAAPPPPTE
jgi:hypothetical protein